MLASKDEYLNEAANSIFQFNTDEQIRKLCRDREEYYQDLRNYERVIAQKDELIEKTMAERDTFLAERDAFLAERDASLAETQRLLTEIELLKKQIQN